MGQRHTLPENPPGVRLISDAEMDRLCAQDPTIPRNPLVRCRTCNDRRWFSWYDGVRLETPRSMVAVEYDCPCIEQWIAHLYLSWSGVPDHLARMAWADLVIPPETRAEIGQYVVSSASYLHQGVGLTLIGGSGTGKSLIAALVLKELLASGHDGYFTAQQSLVDLLMSSWRSEDDRNFFLRRIRNSGVLVVEDLHRTGAFRGNDERARDTLETILRARAANDKPTIVTTKELPSENDLLQILVNQSKVVNLSGPSYFLMHTEKRDAEIDQGLTRPITFL